MKLFKYSILLTLAVILLACEKEITPAPQQVLAGSNNIVQTRENPIGGTITATNNCDGTITLTSLDDGQLCDIPSSGYYVWSASDNGTGYAPFGTSITPDTTFTPWPDYRYFFRSTNCDDPGQNQTFDSNIVLVEDCPPPVTGPIWQIGIHEDGIIIITQEPTLTFTIRKFPNGQVVCTRTGELSHLCPLQQSNFYHVSSNPNDGKIVYWE